MNDQLRVQGVNQSGFGIIPKMVMQDKDLHINSKAIYAYFCSFAGAGDSCFPTRKKICYDMGISNDTLSKYLKQLIEKGYISCEQEKEHGKFSHNVYTLNSTILPCPKTSDTENVVYDRLDTNNNSYNNNSYYKNNNNKEKEYKERDLSIATGSSLDAQDSSLECDTNFNADNGIKKDTFYQRVRDDKPVLMNGVDVSYAFSMLYSFYPKRVGKKEAASAFLDLVRENTKDRIIELAINIDTYKKYTFDNGTESKYIKNMQGFISSTQYNEYEKYNCDVLIGGKYYKTKQDYMDAVISGEVEMYLLPRSCIML